MRSSTRFVGVEHALHEPALVVVLVELRDGLDDLVLELRVVEPCVQRTQERAVAAVVVEEAEREDRLTAQVASQVVSLAAIVRSVGATAVIAGVAEPEDRALAEPARRRRRASSSR